jgi:hypothetical protein
MTGSLTNTLDTIHVALEHLGYTGQDFAVVRPVPLMHVIYRKPGESVTVAWQIGSTVYHVSATTDAAILVLHDELTSTGLMCTSRGKRMDV